MQIRMGLGFKTEENVDRFKRNQSYLVLRRRVQEMNNSGRVKTRTVPGESNSADHLTKGKSSFERICCVGLEAARLLQNN